MFENVDGCLLTNYKRLDLSNYDRIISDALEKQNQNVKKTRSLILITNIYRQAQSGQCVVLVAIYMIVYMAVYMTFYRLAS